MSSNMPYCHLANLASSKRLNSHGLDANNKRCGKRFTSFKKLISICIFLPQLFTTIYICYCIIVYLDVRIDLWLRYIFGTWPKKCITFAKHSHSLPKMADFKLQISAATSALRWMGMIISPRTIDFWHETIQIKLVNGLIILIFIALLHAGKNVTETLFLSISLE